MIETEIVVIDKLVYGGQGLASLSSGQKVFVYGVLPKEEVKIKILKRSADYCLAELIEIIKPSSFRIQALDSNYLSTSPWQILNYEYENQMKVEIIQEMSSKYKFLPLIQSITSDKKPYYYRNKMEFSFYGDELGLHLALHKRGSHAKEIIQQVSIANHIIMKSAQQIVDQLESYQVRAADLKSLIVRVDQSNQASVALFVKKRLDLSLQLIDGIKSIKIYLSDYRSPASVITADLFQVGQDILQDQLLGSEKFVYSVLSFFQVNLNLYRQALKDMSVFVKSDQLVDYFCGVGSIGLSLSRQTKYLIDNDKFNIEFAKLNAKNFKSPAKTILANSNQSLDLITAKSSVIVDPPRSGLDNKFLNYLKLTKPQKIFYLSCNPITQFRDIDKLIDDYQIDEFKLYNFFPRTSHIESLMILSRPDRLV